MRRATFLAFSVAANVALGVALWQRHPHALATTTASAPTIAPAVRAPLSDSQRWQEISTPADDTTFVSRLRSAGFPPEVLLALTRERVTARYASRFRALKEKFPPKPYWQTTTWGGSQLDLAGRTEQRALYREIDDTMKTLLGADVESADFYRRDYLARSYGDLPRAKVTEIESINRDYRELGAQIREESKGVTLATDREKLALLESEKRADLARVLSPAELEEYDRRNSPAAGEIRTKFRFFEGTEEDFVALYHLQRDFDARYGRDNLSGAQSDRRNSALPELAKQIAAALGPERYADYEVVTDGNYGATRSLLPSLGLSTDLAKDLVRAQRTASQRAESIRNDASLSPEQRTTQLAALEKESTEKVFAALGSAENLASYKRYGTGQWLSRLNPAPKPGNQP